MAECIRCDRYFNTSNAYYQHIANSASHNICDDCHLDFSTWTGRKEHWVQNPRHMYCQHCNEHYGNRGELDHHYDVAHSWCSACRVIFTNDIGLKEHYRQSPLHHYCQPCNKLFSSASNLTSHLNSSTHRPKDVACPGGCGGKFVSRSALVLHLENGACTSGINRNMVNRVVRQHDTSNIITDPARLIGGGPGTAQQEVTYIATGASWNGQGFQCYLCNKVHSSLRGLNQHLASPKHQDEIYVCRGSACGQRFRVLSALVAHIESEKCGISKFRYVQSTMDSLLGQMGRLTF